MYDFSQVTYKSLFLIVDPSQTDTGFTVVQTVTRFPTAEEGLLALQTNYEKYRNDNLYFRLLIDIPGLDFTANADEYYLWCEQPMRESSVAFVGESVTTCYYWSVYGRFYSELRVSMTVNIGAFNIGGERHFSTEILNDVLNRADNKLLLARWWFK